MKQFRSIFIIFALVGSAYADPTKEPPGITQQSQQNESNLDSNRSSHQTLLKSDDKDKPNSNISEAFNKLNFQTFQVNPETLTGSLDINIGNIIVNPLSKEFLGLSVTNHPGLPKYPLSPDRLDDKNAFSQTDISLQLGNQFVLNLPSITVNLYTLDDEGSAEKPFILSQVLSMGSVFQDFTAYSSTIDKSGKEDRLVFNPSKDLRIVNPYDKYGTEFGWFEAIPATKGTNLTRPYQGFKYIDQSGVKYEFTYKGYTLITRDVEKELGDNETLSQSYFKISRITYPNQTELFFLYSEPTEAYTNGKGYLNTLESINIKYNGEQNKFEKIAAKFIYDSDKGGLKELQEIVFNPASTEERAVGFNYNRNGRYYNLEKITLEDKYFPQSYKFSYTRDEMLSITYPSGEKDTFSYKPLFSMTPWNDGYRCDFGGAGAIVVQPDGDDRAEYCKNFSPRQIISEVTRWDSHGNQVFIDRYDIVKPGSNNQIKISSWNSQAKKYETHTTSLIPTYYGSGSYIKVENVQDAESTLKDVKSCFEDAELKHYDPMLSCAQYYKSKDPAKIFPESGIDKSYWFEYVTKHIRDYYHSEDDDIIEYTAFSIHRPVAKLSAQGNIKDITSYEKETKSENSIFFTGLKGYFNLETYLYNGESNYWSSKPLAASFSELSKNYDKPTQVIARQYYQPRLGEITPLSGLLTINEYENNYGQLSRSDEYQLAVNVMEPSPKSLIKSSIVKYDTNLYKEQASSQSKSFVLPVMEEKISYPKVEGLENQFEYQIKKTNNQLIQFNANAVKIPVIKMTETSVKYSKENEKVIKKFQFDYAASGFAFGQVTSELQYLAQTSAGIKSSPDVEKSYLYSIEDEKNSNSTVKISTVNTDYSATKLSGIPSRLQQPDRWISLLTGDLLKSVSSKGIEKTYKYNSLGMLTEKVVSQSNSGTVLSKNAYDYAFSAVSSLNSQPTTYRVIERLNDKNANIQWLNDQGRPQYVYEHSVNNASQENDGWLNKPSATANYLNNGQIKEMTNRTAGKENVYIFQYDPGLLMNEKSRINKYSKQPLDKVISLQYPQHNLSVLIHLVKEKIQEITLTQINPVSRSNEKYTILGGPEYKYFQIGQEVKPNTKISSILSSIENYAGWDNHKLLYALLEDANTIFKLKKYAIYHELSYQDNIGRIWRAANVYRSFSTNGEPVPSAYEIVDSEYDFRGNLTKTFKYEMNRQPVASNKIPDEYILSEYNYDSYNNMIKLSKTDKGKSGKKYTFDPKIIYSAGGFIKQDQEGTYTYCENSNSGCSLGKIKTHTNLDGGVVRYAYNEKGDIESIEVGEEYTKYFYTSGNHPKVSSIENDVSRLAFSKYNYVDIPTKQFQEFSPDGKTLYKLDQETIWEDDGNVKSKVKMIGAKDKYLHYNENYKYIDGNLTQSIIKGAPGHIDFNEISSFYFYNDLNQITSEQKKGLSTQYEYDSLGKQSSNKTIWNNGQSSLLTEYFYNNKGSLSARKFNLSDETLGKHKRTELYRYTTESKLEEYTCQINSGSNDFCPSDEHGRPIKKADYSYDIIDNLVSIKFYYFDGSENIATYEYDKNQPDQMTKIIYSKVPEGVTGTNQFEYDKNGQVIYHHDETDWTKWNPEFYKANIHYRADGKISDYQYEDLKNKYKNSFIFKYDVIGNQFSEQKNDHLNFVSYFDTQNKLNARYLLSNKTLVEDLVQVFNSGYLLNFKLKNYSVEFLNVNAAISDGNSIVGNIDQYGKLSSFKVYSPFGISTDILEKLTKFKSEYKDETPYGYNQELTNSEIGWQYLGTYRTYSPNFRHFLQHDSWSPFGDGGINGYAYANNNPINYYDPSGHVTHLHRFFAHLGQGILYTALGLFTGSHGLIMAGVGSLVDMGYDISNAGQDGWDYDDGVSHEEFAAMETGQLAANFIGLGVEKSMYRIGGKLARSVASVRGQMTTQFTFNILGGVVSSPVYSAPYLINEARKGNEFDGGKFWGEMILSGLTTGFIETGPNKLLDEGFSKVRYKGFAHDTEFKRKWWGGFAESLSTRIESNQYFKFAFNADHLRMMDATGTAIKYYKSRMRAAYISRINYFLLKDGVRNFTDAFYGWKERFYEQLR